MVSWAADPPGHAGVIGGAASESWRSWLTTQLAAALIAGRPADPHAPDQGDPRRDPRRDPGRDPVRFALRRAAALRIDPRTWIPADTVWRSVAT